MASVRRKPLKTAAHGKPAFVWQVRWRDPAGQHKARNFRTSREARTWAARVESDKARGEYGDPRAGLVTLADYAADWLAVQTFDPNTRQAVELRLRLHAMPYLGDRPLASIAPSHVQAMLRALQGRLAPTYVRTVLTNLSAIFSAAVDDGRLARNPCKAASVRAPRVVARRVIPWPAERVHAVRDALPGRYRIAVTLAAGCGLRQGEVFGLSPDDVDFLRGMVHVRRQVKIVRSRLLFAAPKGGRSRDVPLPESVALALSAHIAAHPPEAVTLPWADLNGPGETVRLLVTSRERKAMNRNYWNTHLWKPALAAGGVEPTRDNGCHALRHWFASVLLDAGNR